MAADLKKQYSRKNITILRVLHVIANLAPRYGGPPKACFEMARAVASLGHYVTIFTTNQDGASKLNVPTGQSIYRDGVEIRYFSIQRPHFWGFSFSLALQLRKAVREADIIHIHSLYLFHNLITPYYCRKSGIPYLIRPHGSLDPFIFRRHRIRKQVMEVLFEHRNIKNAAGIHFTTEEEKKLSAPHTLKAPAIVVPLGLDVNEYDILPLYGTFRSSYPETIGKKIVLFFGRLNFKKGLDLLVKAFVNVAKSRPDAHLVVAGPDNEAYGEKIKHWLRLGNVLERTTFTGMLEGKDKLSVLRDSDVFVLPSYSENFGISVLEAMACGLPVVISDKVSLWSEVASSAAGIVIPCNSDSLSTAILKLLKNHHLARRMGEQGKSLVAERFQWSTIAYQLERLYLSIIRQHKPKRPSPADRL